MPEAAFACPKCKTDFEIDPGVSDVTAKCPNCQSLLAAHFFPAFFHPIIQGIAATAVTDQTDASCFYHPQKQAAHVCDGCGRLICSLCSIDLGIQHLCPTCLSAGKKKGKFATLENSRIRYDSISLTLAALGLCLSFFSFVLSPVSIYLSIRHWNSPASLLGGNRSRFVAAIIISILSLLIWGGLLGFMIFGPSRIHTHHHA